VSAAEAEARAANDAACDQVIRVPAAIRVMVRVMVRAVGWLSGPALCLVRVGSRSGIGLITPGRRPSRPSPPPSESLPSESYHPSRFQPEPFHISARPYPRHFTSHSLAVPPLTSSYHVCICLLAVPPCPHSHPSRFLRARTHRRRAARGSTWAAASSASAASTAATKPAGRPAGRPAETGRPAGCRYPGRPGGAAGRRFPAPPLGLLFSVRPPAGVGALYTPG
jgi:hypothetical protein